jgi:NAD(P)-dependent dehydrogenase (short-subunit alcohol dehydrogenase family)
MGNGETIMTSKRVALITAGGSGMGAAAAKRLAADGYSVGILSSSGKGEALGQELGGIGVTGSNQSADDLSRLVNLAIAKWDRIDVLVNSAGHGPRGPVLELSDDDWHTGMEVYFLSAVRPTRLVTPIMQKQQSGSIINLSTFAAFEPDPVFPTSGVMRAGLAAFAKLYSDKYAAENIRMNNVLPGFIDSLPENQEFRDRVPMRRYGQVEEIAATVAFLASEGGAYITGQNIRVDGGITRSV